MSVLDRVGLAVRDPEVTEAYRELKSTARALKSIRRNGGGGTRLHDRGVERLDNFKTLCDQWGANFELVGRTLDLNSKE